MPRHHDDESPHYRVPHDPTENSDLQVPPSVPPPFTTGSDPQATSSGASAPADVVAQSSGAVSTATPSTATPSTATPSSTSITVSQRDHAYTLYCQGLRSDTIAARLGVPPRTVRRWLHRSRQELILNVRDKYISELLRTIEGQRAVIAAAWAAYGREHRLEDEILAGQHDYLRRRTLHLAPDSPVAEDIHVSPTVPWPFTAPSDVPPRPGSPFLPREGGQGVRSEATQGVTVLHEEYDRPHRYNVGARYLAVIIAAQREVARLQGLYDEIANLPPPRAEIIITRRPEGPENIPPPRPGHAPPSYIPPYDSDDGEDDGLPDPDDPFGPDNDPRPDQSRHL